MAGCRADGERALIRGRLYSHATARPCVIMGHGYSATVDGMVADDYAEVLHRADLAVLLFDHEGFGRSDGEPRRVINRWLQCRGYQHALEHAADVVTSAHVSDEVPVVSPDRSAMLSLLEPVTAFEWFTRYGERAGSTWVNRARTASVATPVPYFTDHVVPHPRCPSSWIIAEDDEMPGADPEVALRCFELADGAASKVLVDGGHFGLLHPDRPVFARSSRAQAEFLVAALGLDPPEPTHAGEPGAERRGVHSVFTGDADQGDARARAHPVR